MQILQKNAPFPDKYKSLVAKMYKDLILAQYCISKPLEIIKKQKRFLFFHEIKARIILLIWFKEDKKNIKQISFDFNNLQLYKLTHFYSIFSVYTPENRKPKRYIYIYYIYIYIYIDRYIDR